MNDLIVTRKGLESKARQKIESGKMGALQLVDFNAPALSGKFGKMSQKQRFATIEKLTSTDRLGNAYDMSFTKGVRVESAGFDVPMEWSDGSKKTVRQALNDGMFKPEMLGGGSSNTLPVDWDNLWDAMRINVTVRKAALPTIREFIYNVTSDPNFTRELKPTEVSPFGVVFEENNGHGEAIPQGETLGGGYDVFYILIYAAGFTWDLMGELFDLTITPERIMDAVMVGYNAIRDSLALTPIIEYSYSGAQQTAASTVGSLRQELLYNTLVDGLDDLGDRDHPVTDRNLDVSNVIMLANPFDARHIAQVASGLPSSNERTYPAISEISQILAYDDEVIRLRIGSVTYTGVTKGTAYMLIPASSLPAGGYMEIAVKRDLQVEIDPIPDLKTLSREERAYWFAEGLWYEGVQYFVQELTLPTW